MPQRCGRQLDQAGGQPDCRFRPEMEISRRVGQSHHLLGCDADYGLLAITDIDAPQPRKRIQELVAINVTKIRAVAGLEDRCPPTLMLVKIDDRMDQELTVEVD